MCGKAARDAVTPFCKGHSETQKVDAAISPTSGPAAACAQPATVGGGTAPTAAAKPAALATEAPAPKKPKAEEAYVVDPAL